MSTEEFKWSGPSEEAAQLIADGNLTLNEIAEKVGVDRRTLWNWRQNGDFTARVDEYLDAFRKEVRRRGIAVRERRIQVLDDQWNRLQTVIAERAVSAQMQGVPGGETGLICHNVKGVGKGEDFQLVDIYEVDTGLLKELREHARQAAQELGQWVEKQETEVTAKAYITVGPEDL